MSARHRPQPIEIETLADFDRLTTSHKVLAGWQIQGLNLTDRDQILRQTRPTGALFLGCTLHEDTADWLRRRGALLFPKVPNLPFDPYRAHLYTGTELYAGLDTSYDATPDAQIYAWWRADGHSLTQTLAESLHDHSIDDALDEWVIDRRIVGIMGGHATRRGTSDYAAAARLSRILARNGLSVATGGGPGSMEAANLGARLCDLSEPDLQKALDDLAVAPDFTQVAAWASTGLQVAQTRPDSGLSLGIPTWFYGHEPPNPFASQIAKYFRNALREDILLSVCNAGVVFLPGSAGTVQEIFQAACKVYYAAPGSDFAMVLVGHEYWTEVLPAWSLLGALGQGHPMRERIFLVDDAESVSEILLTQSAG
ncbi:MAG: Rossmann fold nucleotide-binding protein [Nocardioidaceae bacterium]